MPSAFLIDYIVWVFASTLAVIQIAAAQSGLSGLLYARRWPRASAGIGVVVVIASATWYFATEDRNQPDTGLGLDANVQAFWFAVSGSLAAATTLVVGSIINHRWGKNHGWDSASGAAPPAGITWLARTTFFHAIRARIAHSRSTTDKRAEA